MSQEPLTPASPSNMAMEIAKKTLLNIEIVIGISIILATLFTAWTPGERSTAPSWEIAQFAPIATLLPTLGPTPTPDQRPRIGIVAGHYRNDSGATCPDGLKEVDINLEIAEIVRRELTEAGYIVDLLAEFDTKLRDYQALALVSIHADSCEYVNEEATGYKVAAALASPDPERATHLTACLRSRYAQATGLPLHSTSVTRDMTEYHAFDEINERTTAAIIETGFLNRDRDFLINSRDKAALGIVNGITCFLNNESISTGELQPPP